MGNFNAHHALLHLKRPDLSDQALVRLLIAVATSLAVFLLVLRPLLPAAWRTPGSPELYLCGVAGALLLLVSMVFVVVKRTTLGGPAPAWFIAHVVASTLGTLLVLVHSAGHLGRPPALLILALLGLIALGVRARLRVSRRMAATFASKERAFAPVRGASRERLGALIQTKRRLLATLDPQANEATFSPTLVHWLRQPRTTSRYARLVHEEFALIGARASVGAEQAWWRPLHLALAALFFVGLLVHIVTVTFFAGYVADGGPITWWHLADW